MMKAEPTPTPWQIDPYSDETIAICTVAGDVHIGILEPRDAADGERNREADAEFIVRACNSHADLVAALTPVRVALTDAADFGSDTWNTEDHVEITLTLAEARAIRAAFAKGEQPR